MQIHGAATNYRGLPPPSEKKRFVPISFSPVFDSEVPGPDPISFLCSLPSRDLATAARPSPAAANPRTLLELPPSSCSTGLPPFVELQCGGQPPFIEQQRDGRIPCPRLPLEARSSSSTSKTSPPICPFWKSTFMIPCPRDEHRANRVGSPVLSRLA